MIKIILLLFVISSTVYGKIQNIQMVDILKILIQNQSITLDSKINLGCRDSSLGSYMAILISNGSKGDKKKLSANCSDFLEYTKVKFGTLKKHNNDKVWYCFFDSFTSDKDGKSPWHYSVQFVLDKKTKKILKPSIICPGLP